MKYLRRFASLFLSIALACPASLALPVMAMAEDDINEERVGIKGSIGITIGFDLPQTFENVEKRDIELKLTKGNESAEFSLNTGDKSGNGFENSNVQITAKNKDGVEVTTEEIIGAYEAVISNLDEGTYELELSGKGMTTFTEEVELEDYSKHMIVANSNGTFSVGDVDGNGKVNDDDREELSEQLGTEDSNVKYDLNGDGIIDIVDLAYINRTMGNDDEAELYETAAIGQIIVNTSDISIKDGAAEDLFNDSKSVEIEAKDNEIIIPITFNRDNGVEMEQIAITSPTGDGAVEGGSAEIEYADGSTETVVFGNEMPEGVHAIGRVIDRSTVVIDLGKRVAVKKVTIKVTKVTGGDGNPEYAAITKIEFLKDIVPDVIDTNASKVKGVTAVGGDKKVSLRWNTVNNASSYVINYGKDRNSLNKIAESNKTSAEISGLDNFKEYYFTVTAANGSWRGKPSDVVSATPKPQSIPGAPSNISVESADRALRVGWGKTKDASFYQVFYRVKGESQFSQFGEDTTSTNMTITGLTNGTEYEIVVKAGNEMGVGPNSAIAEGTPKVESFEEPNFPTEGRIDRDGIVSIVMTDKNNVDTKLCPNFTVEDLVDGSAGTYWIAKHYNLNSGITYTFEEPHDMNYILVAPYLDARYRNRIDTYTISATNEAGEEILSYFGYAANVNDDNYIAFTFPATENIKSITVGLGEKVGGPRVSISEIAFYNSDTLAEDIANLFEDNAFTKLKGSVTAEQISALSERLSLMSSFYMDIDVLREELNIASGLFEGSNSSLGVVKDNFQSRSGDKDRKFGQAASELQPIGVSAKADKYIAVYANVPDDVPVYLVPTQYYGESGIWRGSAVRLENGRNYIKIGKIGSLSDTRGGMLYVTYGGNNPEEIKLHVPKNSNIYSIPVLELSNWYSMSVTERKNVIGEYVQELSDHVSALKLSDTALKTAIQNATEISTPSILLSLPADRILAGIKGVSNDVGTMTDIMYDNVMAWEEVLFVANKVQGIIDANEQFESYEYPMSTRQNIRYMRMFAGAFMYAAGNHVGIEYGSASALACGKPTSKTGNESNRLFGWGIAHEIGHNMDKLGKAEITNNIYSLAVQTWNGSDMTLPSRLTNSNIWNPIYDKVSAARPGSANNVFVQLGMYWQLHLAYDDGTNPLNFYNSFFKLWKDGKYSDYDYDSRVALIASEVANKDLSDFFEHWGMILSDDVISKMSAYGKEDRAIWYLNDSSREYRLNGGTGGIGKTTVSANANENLVTIEIENTNSENILGYEIRRNGTPVGFTTTESYVDDLGAANNYTYTYSVLPIDRLGNIGQEAEADEIRIAYDKKIAADLYDTETVDGVIKITMKGDAVPVTGIIAENVAEGTAFEVRVKADKEQAEWIVAKTGEIDKIGEPIYFNKPGVDLSDPRIWAYDVAVMEIEIAGGANISLLDYPGDRIDFNDKASVGILSSDYDYGEDIISKGTIVVVGKYRGNPVFNNIKVEARYNTAVEAAEKDTSIERVMNGYALLLCELPEDNAVSDTSDGMFIFVPNWEEEKALNTNDGVTDDFPMEIKAAIYRSDDPNSSDDEYVTGETLWISFPDDESMPYIDLR